MTTQPELIETCRDCGDPSPAPICTECAEIAELFGLTPEQRLTQIGGAA